jgi:hypothetical protein
LPIWMCALSCIKTQLESPNAASALIIILPRCDRRAAYMSSFLRENTCLSSPGSALNLSRPRRLRSASTSWMTINSIKPMQVVASLQNQASMKIVFPFHNIHIPIVHMAISSISDSDIIMPAYHSEIVWFHCSQSFLIDSFSDPVIA